MFNIMEISTKNGQHRNPSISIAVQFNRFNLDIIAISTKMVKKINPSISNAIRFSARFKCLGNLTVPWTTYHRVNLNKTSMKTLSCNYSKNQIPTAQLLYYTFQAQKAP